jgi:hypothetical protein
MVIRKRLYDYWKWDQIRQRYDVPTVHRAGRIVLTAQHRASHQGVPTEKWVDQMKDYIHTPPQLGGARLLFSTGGTPISYFRGW